jgi:hypothetical protein
MAKVAAKKALAEERQHKRDTNCNASAEKMSIAGHSKNVVEHFTI